jgi:hypothetical protein
MGVFRHRQAFPWHPRIEGPQDEVKEAMIAEFTLGSALGHREVRQDKLMTLNLSLFVAGRSDPDM